MENSREYSISAPIPLGYTRVNGEDTSLPRNIRSQPVDVPFYQTICEALEIVCIRPDFVFMHFMICLMIKKSGLHHLVDRNS